jgi:hypothetical protein
VMVTGTSTGWLKTGVFCRNVGRPPSAWCKNADRKRCWGGFSRWRRRQAERATSCWLSLGGWTGPRACSR